MGNAASAIINAASAIITGVVVTRRTHNLITARADIAEPTAENAKEHPSIQASEAQI
jgi:hypothetical protein